MENTSLSPAPVEAQARQKPSGTKRIKISRACDECRKRKVAFFLTCRLRLLYGSKTLVNAVYM